MNNESNTFSKHSPVLALQGLKRLGRVEVKPVKSVVNQVGINQIVKSENVKPMVKAMATYQQVPNLS